MPRIASTLLPLAALPVGGTSLYAQSCSSLPVGESELWVGGASWSGTEHSAVEMGFALNMLDRIHLSADMGVQTMVVSAGGSFRVKGLDVCLFGAREVREYPFRDRFELDRGDVLDGSNVLGIQLGRSLIGNERISLGW